MARCRKLSTGISLDLEVNRLGDFTALLYTWMIPHAEDDCSLPKEPEVIAAQVMPLRGVTVEKVKAAIGEMLDAGLLLLCDDGRLRYEPKAFYRYQTYINASKRWEAEEQQESAENSKKQQETAENSTSLSLSFSPSLSPSLSTESWPVCMSQEVEKDGLTASLKRHIIESYVPYLGIAWVEKMPNRVKVGKNICLGCPDECPGDEKRARSCATAFIRAARELAEEKEGKTFPVQLLLYRLREGAR
jgi:hypothetical protein